jgi:hypothetical protein
VKKCFRSRKYKHANNIRARKQEQRALKHNAWRKHQNKQDQSQTNRQRRTRIVRRHRWWDYKKVHAPSCFSFLKNPSGVSTFIQKLKKNFNKKKKVYVVLRGINEIDDGAIVVLLSIMVRFKARKISFNGDFPADSLADMQLKRSGFFEHIGGTTFKEKRWYQISGSQKNGIHTHANKNVSSKLGSEIIASAAKTIWGKERRCQGVQRVLIELMQNTNNHADIDKQGNKHWWLSTNHNKENKTVSFSFVDYGVGVFNSLENKSEDSKFYDWKAILSKVFLYKSNTELMEVILNGTLHKTVTGKPFRGKGLPGVAQALKRNQISNLCIITNNVFCNYAQEKYTALKVPFSGTFIYWELTSENYSCK